MVILWKYPGEGSNRYTYIRPFLMSGGIDCTTIWVRHMGGHYIQATGVWVFVLLSGIGIYISLNFTWY